MDIYSFLVFSLVVLCITFLSLVTVTVLSTPSDCFVAHIYSFLSVLLLSNSFLIYPYSSNVDKTVTVTNDKKVIHNTTRENTKKEYIYNRDLIDFEKFWKGLHGRKLHKPAALKAYVQIDTEFSAEELAQKFNELVHSREEKFVPYPQKWLKNEGWNDEIKEESSGKAWVPDRDWETAR